MTPNSPQPHPQQPEQQHPEQQHPEQQHPEQQHPAPQSQPQQPDWQPTQARVTACKYQFARLHTLTLGISPDSNPFLITFTYYAHAKSYSGQFTAPAYLAQDTLFPLTYNPLDPQQNSKTASNPTTRTPLFAIAIAGSILLSLLYLTLLRGCS